MQQSQLDSATLLVAKGVRLSHPGLPFVCLNRTEVDGRWIDQIDGNGMLFRVLWYRKNGEIEGMGAAGFDESVKSDGAGAGGEMAWRVERQTTELGTKRAPTRSHPQTHASFCFSPSSSLDFLSIFPTSTFTPNTREFPILVFPTLPIQAKRHLKPQPQALLLSA